jgi:hypothetical protein
VSEEISTYQDLSDLASVAEDVPEGIQSKDYTDRRLAPPGRDYVSLSRSIKAKQKPDKSITFEITLAGGLTKESDGRTYFAGGKYPLRTWVSTKLWRREGQPGSTSGVAEYLKLFIDPATGKRYDAKGLTTTAAIAAMQATAGSPVKVVIGWRDKGVATGEVRPDGTKVYRDLGLKTKDFLVEGNGVGAPHYTPEIVRDGQTIFATEYVVGFARL